ncbi:MAG: hypothetical protein IPI39_09410 [Candidatus Obscuribacter sp.]|jgi:hypothetical protein|nr:hypothetical protein [Candidatus Obscuribacter sp.]MBK7838562.1 hypothetical protein [Candidatus Obscuribacter sp.]
MRKHLRILASDEEQVKANWLVWFLMAAKVAALVGLVNWLFPTAIPYSFFQLWHTTGTPVEWLWASWPILVWAIGWTALISALTLNSRRENYNAEAFYARGLWLSLRAGVMEEVVFRWLLFMWSIAMAKAVDYILGGFIFEHGFVWWFQTTLILPVANFFTMGLLKSVLTDASTWYIAAGLIIANSRFRDGHKYQGLFGLINSWFIGMYFFYLMFTFGLVAAIVVHLVYDVLIFTIRYLDQLQERARGVHKDSNQ